MKILVTGGSGFVGSNLINSLSSDDHDIILVIRNKNKLNNVKMTDKIHIDYVDVTDFSKLSKSILDHKPDVIFHLAGETSHKQSFENPMYDVDVNAKSTLVILETIRNHSLPCKFILGSTFIVIGKPTELPINENSICNPTTIYGSNRLTSENYCKIYHNLFNIDAMIFRITNSFGPLEQYKTPTKNAVNFLIYQAYKGNEISIYNKGEFFRDLIFISDVVSGLKTIMNKGISGNLYWIASGQKTWFHDLGKWLYELTGTSVKYVESPTYTSKVDVGNFLVDNSKLSLLGWKPNVSAKYGISKTLDYFKENSL
jgi:UDP-glucose 4-epimerase